MKRAIIIANLAGSFIIFGLTINLFDAILMFVLFGFIPGQSARVSAEQMLWLYQILGSLLAAYLLRPALQRIIPRVRATFKPSAPVVPTRRRARA